MTAFASLGNASSYLRSRCVGHIEPHIRVVLLVILQRAVMLVRAVDVLPPPGKLRLCASLRMPRLSCTPACLWQAGGLMKICSELSVQRSRMRRPWLAAQQVRGAR